MFQPLDGWACLSRGDCDMDTLEMRLQRRINASLYALLFLTVLLGISVLLEGCSKEGKQSKKIIDQGYRAFLDSNLNHCSAVSH